MSASCYDSGDFFVGQSSFMVTSFTQYIIQNSSLHNMACYIKHTYAVQMLHMYGVVAELLVVGLGQQLTLVSHLPTIPLCANHFV